MNHYLLQGDTARPTFAADAVGFKQTHTIWRQEAWATDVS